jgi:putative ABC transport system permease protein
VIVRLVWENIRFRPVRTLLSVLLIGVPVMLILTLVGVSQGFMDESKQRTRGVGADVMVKPPGSSFTTGSSGAMPEKLVARLAEVPHVAQATGIVTVLAGKLWDSVTGIDYAAFKRMSGGFTFIEGDDANAFVHPDDMVVDSDYAAEQHPNLHLGSATKLLNRTWRVSAIVESGKLSHVFVPIAVLQELNNSPGRVSQIYLKLDDPKNIPEVIDAVQKLLPEYGVYSIKEWIDLTSVDRIPAVGIFVNVIIGIGVFTGLIVVSLSMYMAVLHRTREIGILKSLGATKAFVMSLILWEAALMGLGGTIAGIALSFVSRAALKQFVPASLPQAIVPAWWPIVLGIALGSALLGAIYPGMIAVRHDPIEALAYE